MQSDKASVEITSRFAGVVKKLHYEAGEMAKVGKPFVDIDLPDDVTTSVSEEAPAPVSPANAAPETTKAPIADTQQETPKPPAPAKKKFSGSSLATPAVRHLSKELNVDISLVDGTGKDGRVTKEDLHRYVEEQKSGCATTQQDGSPATPARPLSSPFGAMSIDAQDAPQQESAVSIGGMQLQMFKAMTRSLTIPHFLYADEIDFTQLYSLRQRVNATLARAAKTAAAAGNEAAAPASAPAPAVAKLSYMPFIIKAMSMALHQYPVLNARVEVPADAAGKPNLVYRSQHNIGVAMDTPVGLIVPVIKNVNARSIMSIAGELVRLQSLAKAGKLAPADLQGGTITVSNIGNVGGTYLSPVIVEREVAILGMGRVRTVPAFADDADDGTGAAAQRIIKRHVCHFSFSADHRVVDGATLARAAEMIRELVEKPDTMIVQLR